MNISLILAHPDPASFNHAIARTALARLELHGHTVNFHDLHRKGFDPLLPPAEFGRGASLPESIAAHCAEISLADGIIIVHPNWWGQPPAILTGWIDRVIRPGLAYEFSEGDGGEGVPRGLLKARTAFVYNTGNTELGRERQVFGDPLETIWRNCVFGLCGASDVRRRLFGVMITSTIEQREVWLADVRRDMDEAFGPVG